MINSNIVLLKSSEIDRASEILARAFDEDPMFRYFAPEAEFSTLNERSQHEMSEPHYILSLLGVEPSDRGQGIGSLLLQPVLEQADRKSVPCYLATFTEQAVGFYQKHGFVVLWQGKFSDDSPCIWTMKRKPHPTIVSSISH